DLHRRCSSPGRRRGTSWCPSVVWPGPPLYSAESDGAPVVVAKATEWDWAVPSSTRCTRKAMKATGDATSSEDLSSVEWRRKDKDKNRQSACVHQRRVSHSYLSSFFFHSVRERVRDNVLILNESCE